MNKQIFKLTKLNYSNEVKKIKKYNKGTTLKLDDVSYFESVDGKKVSFTDTNNNQYICNDSRYMQINFQTIHYGLNILRDGTKIIKFENPDEVRKIAFEFFKSYVKDYEEVVL